MMAGMLVVPTGMMTADEIAVMAWRGEIFRLRDLLPGPDRSAVDLVWSEGVHGFDETRHALEVVQAMVRRSQKLKVA